MARVIQFDTMGVSGRYTDVAELPVLTPNEMSEHWIAIPADTVNRPLSSFPFSIVEM